MLSIRTQCKRALIPYKNIIYIEKRGENKWCLDIEEAHVYLGTYKTKERALQVLDEIEKSIHCQISYQYGMVTPIVYQMPKE